LRIKINEVVEDEPDSRDAMDKINFDMTRISAEGLIGESGTNT
jgi:ABC-type oligopeptide transport system ATPase subunit